jgi:hypothetical protein
LIVAADFFTVEVWTARELKRFLVLFFIDCPWQVEIAGIASNANGLWMSQIGRRVTDAVDGILNGKRYLIHDRDPLFTTEFQDILASVGVAAVKLPPQSPNLNAYAERFVRSSRDACLDRLILFGEASLRRAIQHFILHCHEERNHQGKGNQLLFPRAVLSSATPHGNVRCQQAARRAAQVLSPRSGMSIGQQPIQLSGFYAAGLLCLAAAVLKITIEGHWSWWRVLLPFWAVLGHNILFIVVGFTWLFFVSQGPPEEEDITIRQDPPQRYEFAAMLCFLLFAHNLLGRIEGAGPAAVGMARNGSMAVALTVRPSEPDLSAFVLV